MKKQFVVPTLRSERALTDLTLGDVEPPCLISQCPT